MQHTPCWRDAVLEARPDVVSEVLAGCARPPAAGGRRPSPTSSTTSPGPASHAAVARLAWAPLLKAFPTRAARKASSQDWVSCSRRRLRHGDAPSFLAVVDRKLTRHSMNISQRVYWFAAGLLASPDTYLSGLRTYVAGSERRIRFLASFLAGRDFPAPLLQRLRSSGTGAPGAGVRKSRTGREPRPSGEAYRIDHSMQVSDRVEDFVNRLAAFPTRAASEALGSLMCHAGTEPWHTHLAYARHRQSSLRRETCFRHCSVSEVVEVLAKPAPRERRRSGSADDVAPAGDFPEDPGRQYLRLAAVLERGPVQPAPGGQAGGCVPRRAVVGSAGTVGRTAGRCAARRGATPMQGGSDIRIAHGGHNVPVEDQEGQPSGSVERDPHAVDRKLHARPRNRGIRHLPRVLVR